MFGIVQYFAASCATKGITIIPAWYEYIDGSGTSPCELNFTFPDDVGLVLLAILDMLLRIAGLVAVGYVIYGGVNYIISQGEPDKVGAAKQMILNAIIGLIIAMLAVAIVNFVGNSFLNS